MSKTKLITTIVTALSVIPSAACQTEVTSPNGKVRATILTDKAGRLMYQLKRDNNTIIEKSPLGVTVDGIDLGNGVTVGTADEKTINQTYATRGVHKTAVNHCRVEKIPISHTATNTDYILETRVFNDGFAFRYIVPGTRARTVNNEATAWRLPKGSKVWFQKSSSNYEELYRQKPPDTC